MVRKTFREEVRILGVDDCSFNRFEDKHARIIGVFFRGGNYLDGVISSFVEVDGDDATDKIHNMIFNSRFLTSTKAIMLDGIAVAGFNVIDIQRLNRSTGIPIIVVIRKYPDIDKMFNAMKKAGKDEFIDIVKKAGKIKRFRNIYFQNFGITETEAAELIRITSTRSSIPEPIRVAHLIGRGLSEHKT